MVHARFGSSSSFRPGGVYGRGADLHPHGACSFDKAQARLPRGGVGREAISKIASFTGLLAARRAEEAVGLRPRMDGQTLGTDVFASMLGMEIGARLARVALGPAYSLRMRAELLRSRELAALTARHEHPLTKPWLAPLFVAMSSGSVGGLGAVSGSSSGVRPTDGVKLSKTEIYIQDLILRIHHLDEAAVQELYRVPLEEFGKRALAGDPRAIATLEELHDLGHREAVHHLAQVVPKWALREVELARRGEPFRVERVKSMRLAALEGVALQPSDPAYLDCVSALFDLHRMEHPDAEGAIRHAFEGNVDSAVRLLKLARDPNFFGRDTAREISWRSSLGVLVEMAKESGNLKASSTALSALVALLEEAPSHPLAALSLAQVAESNGAELFRHLDMNSLAREGFFYLVESGDLGARLALRLAVQHSEAAWGTFQRRTKQKYDVERMPPTPELSDLIDASRIWENSQAIVERQSFPVASSWPLEDFRNYQVGRDPGGAHRIVLPDRRVSRKHLMLRRQGEALTLIDSIVKYADQQPSYGVWIQNPQHPALWERAVPGVPHTLLPGRSFAIGTVTSALGTREAIVLSWDGKGGLQTQESFINISRPWSDDAPTTAKSLGVQPAASRLPRADGGLLAILGIGSGLTALLAGRIAEAGVSTLSHSSSELASYLFPALVPAVLGGIWGMKGGGASVFRKTVPGPPFLDVVVGSGSNERHLRLTPTDVPSGGGPSKEIGDSTWSVLTAEPLHEPGAASPQVRLRMLRSGEMNFSLSERVAHRDPLEIVVPVSEALSLGLLRQRGDGHLIPASGQCFRLHPLKAP
ncbi:MAG: FHA domain-containing protein [Deltaproteobacteria bacterium]|nr:FHA domain-containing protein [Deltaproteobacteria bacterium]